MTADSMGGSRLARRVRIYLSERDSIGLADAQRAIIAFLRGNHAAGVAVYRGIEGFAASGGAQPSRSTEVPWYLPVIIEWIDAPERVKELLPQLKTLVPVEMITVDTTEVALLARSPVLAVSEAVAVETIMTRELATVRRQTPVREVVDLMRMRSLRAVPVVDEGKVVGIITNSDVVKRGRLGISLTLLPALTPNDQAKRMQGLPRTVAEEIMSAPPVVVASTAPLSEAAKIMVHRKLKRLPVVDDRGSLVGIVSRIDLLRTVADVGEPNQEKRLAVGLNADAPLSCVMREDVPTLYSDSPLDEVVRAVVSTRLNRALVIDATQHVLGMVTALAVLERVTPAIRPSLLKSVMHRLPFSHPTTQEHESERHAAARIASDLMTTDVLKAHPGEPLRAVIAPMLEGAHKLVAVVDDDGRLLGVVDRADVLRGIADRPE